MDTYKAFIIKEYIGNLSKEINLPTNQLEIDKTITRFKSQYSKNKQPIEVSFRKILPELNNQDRFSHLIHAYPAKLLMHIPYFFLNNTHFSKPKSKVLDPFCGTGTVLLEANLAGRTALGADANPLARLIARTKTQKIRRSNLEDQLSTVLKKAKQYKYGIIPEMGNMDFWYPQKTIFNLGRLLRSIKQIKNKRHQDFFLVCFSNCVKKVSFADPRIAVPVRLNPDRYRKNSLAYKHIKDRMNQVRKMDVFKKFESICVDNIERIDRLKYKTIQLKSQVISDDARNLRENIHSSTKLKSNSIDLILTSPPYAGAQKYIRSSSLGLGWLEMADAKKLRELDGQNIGREIYKRRDCIVLQKTGISSADKLLKEIHQIDTERSKIAGNYLIEMTHAIDESIRVLKKGGHFVLVIGNNQVCKREFNTQEYLTKYITKKGLKTVFKLIDGIKSYGLMTKRNKSADIITREYILVFTKP